MIKLLTLLQYESMGTKYFICNNKLSLPVSIQYCAPPLRDTITTNQLLEGGGGGWIARLGANMAGLAPQKNS